jgi:hypothetical protein
VPVVSLLGISCCEETREARGRMSSGGTGDGDSKGGLEQLRIVSSDSFSINKSKTRVCARRTYSVNDGALHILWGGLCGNTI